MQLYQIFTPNKSWDFLQRTNPFSCPERTPYDYGEIAGRHTNMVGNKQGHDVKMDGENERLPDGHLHSALRFVNTGS
jgi:hypothetical protein